MPAVINAKQFAAGHLGKIGSNEERRLHHTDEEVAGHPKALGPSDPQRPGEAPGKSPDQKGKNPPIEKQRRKGTDHQNQRQGTERQNKQISRFDSLEGERTAPQVSENHTGTCCSGTLQGQHHVVERQEQLLKKRHSEQNQADSELKAEPGNDQPNRRLSPPFTHCPGNGQHRQQTDKALKPHHALSPGLFTMDS